jgi:hypothetical protein
MALVEAASESIPDPLSVKAPGNWTHILFCACRCSGIYRCSTEADVMHSCGVAGAGALDAGKCTASSSTCKTAQLLPVPVTAAVHDSKGGVVM